MTTPEPKTQHGTRPPASNSWRDIVQAGADCVQIEGFALEELIDLQRNRARQSGEGR